MRANILSNPRSPMSCSGSKSEMQTFFRDVLRQGRVRDAGVDVSGLSTALDKLVSIAVDSVCGKDGMVDGNAVVSQMDALVAQFCT